MSKLLISSKAREDLEGIKIYIRDELENPTTALNVVARISKRLKDLKDMPDIGLRLSTKVPFETDYRFLICGNYPAFYRHEDKTVYVDRILYGRRDYMKIFFPETDQKKDDVDL